MRLRSLADRLAPYWRVDRPESRTAAGACRVSARFGGREVRFESADAPLVPSTEGLAGMFVAPALRARRTLQIAEEVDPLWARNIGELTRLWRHWWSLDGGPVLKCRTRPEPRGGARSGTALFFTAGVDSFYTLLNGPRADALVYVHGFDLPLEDRARMSRLEPALRRVARATGHRAVIVRTDLREHPRFRRAGWVMAHGGALAGVAHLLKAGFGRAIISSSDTGVFNVPWGSHQYSDPLHSSGDMRIEHAGENIHRLDKIRAIAGDPLVRDNLRVCWEPDSPRLNCGHCEKCLRTMVYLLGLDELRNFPVFEHAPGELPARIDRLGPVGHPYVAVYWADALELELPGEVASAVRRLLGRSRWDQARIQRYCPVGTDLQGADA